MGVLDFIFMICATETGFSCSVKQIHPLDEHKLEIMEFRQYKDNKEVDCFDLYIDYKNKRISYTDCGVKATWP